MTLNDLSDSSCSRNKNLRLYAVWCARQVSHLMTVKKCVSALDVAEAYANGKASREELEGAHAETLLAIKLSSSNGHTSPEWAARAAAAATQLDADLAAKEAPHSAAKALGFDAGTKAHYAVPASQDDMVDDCNRAGAYDEARAKAFSKASSQFALEYSRRCC